MSCIPEGSYLCKFTHSPRYGKLLYILTGVPNRSGIRIHSANYAGDITLGYKRDLLGCIALGSGKFGGPGTNSQLMVTNSRVTMAKFEAEMEGEDFILHIVGAF